jgi:hypothetical protein
MAVMAVDVDAPVAVKERLEAFAGEVLAEAMNRPVQLVNGSLYLRGLLEHGPRKSLEHPAATCPIRRQGQRSSASHQSHRCSPLPRSRASVPPGRGSWTHQP